MAVQDRECCAGDWGRIEFVLDDRDIQQIGANARIDYITELSDLARAAWCISRLQNLGTDN